MQQVMKSENMISADRDADDRRLRNRGLKNPSREHLGEALVHAEAASLRDQILANDKHLRTPVHFFDQRRAYRVAETVHGHDHSPPAARADGTSS
jgi:hypothetical protein